MAKRFIGLLIITLLLLPSLVHAQDSPTYTSPDGSLTFNYPDGWNAGQIDANTYELTNVAGSNGPATGEGYIQIWTTPAVDEIMVQWGFDSTVGTNVVGNLVSSLMPESDQEFITFSDGRQAIFYYSTYSTGDVDYALWMLVLQVPDTDAVLILNLIALPDEIETFRDTLLAVGESMRYTPPAKAPVGGVVWQQQYTMNADNPQPIGTSDGMGLSADGTIYVTDSVNSQIHVFDADGQYVKSLEPFAADQAQATDIAVDPADGSLWVLDAPASVVYHLDAQGTILESLGEPRAVTDPKNFSRGELKIEPTSGNLVLFVGDYSNDSAAYWIQVWDKQGTVLSSFDVQKPIAVGPDFMVMSLGPDGQSIYFMTLTGELWAVDFEGNLIGNYRSIMKAANTTALLIAPDGSILFSADWGGVWLFDATGQHIGDLAQDIPANIDSSVNEYYHPGGLEMLPDGDVILVDSLQNQFVISKLHFDALSGTAVTTSTNTVSPDAWELSQAYVSDDGMFTMSYPDGWTVQETQQATLALTNNAQAMQDFSYGAGDYLLMMSWLSLTDPNTQLAATTERSAPGVAVELQGTFMGMTPDAQFSDPETFTLNERPAARFDGTGGGKAWTVLVVDLGHDWIAFVSMMANDVNERDQFEPTLLKIAESAAISGE